MKVFFAVVAATGLVACAGIHAPNSSISSTSKSEVCTSIPSDATVNGPAFTIAEIEAKSLNEMSANPAAPQVPFGYQNAQWLSIKSLMQPGDIVREYNTRISGGYLVFRGNCLVGQLQTWVQ